MSAEQLDRPVVVITDHTGDEERGYVLTEPSAEVLTLARGLTTGPLYAVALNPAPAVEDLAALGVDHILIPDLAGMSPRIPAVVADAALACVRTVENPVAVLNVSNYRGREVAARLSVLLGSGGAADVNGIRIEDGNFIISKSVLSGSWETVIRIRRSLPVFALRPSSVPAQPVPTPSTPSLTPVQVEYSPQARAVTVVSSHEQEKSSRIPLTEASVVVCGGRGTEGDFTPVEQLADKLGAAVGATRVATDEGWVDRSLQVGQTGVTISPQVYIGLGVSGAVHHTCGMQGSQTVVAVCDDPDAPIFEICDFGVVGDINEVVPQLLESLEDFQA